jgi:hypothetical protein
MWKIEYWDGTNWVEKTDTVLEQIEQELNGHEEVVFTIPNTSDNRTFVSTDKRIRISWSTTVVYTGILKAYRLRQTEIECYVYNECYELMKKRIHTGTYENVPVSDNISAWTANTAYSLGTFVRPTTKNGFVYKCTTAGTSGSTEPSWSTVEGGTVTDGTVVWTCYKPILRKICEDAGVSVGVSPGTQVSVKFDRTLCYDAATYISRDVLGKDFWSDYDASGSPRFNIGDRTNSSPYPSLTPLEVPEKGVDRAKRIDKVIIRGVDSNGDRIYGEAGTGNNVAVFTELKPSDVNTLNLLATAKLAELNKDTSGTTLTVVITDAYSLVPGYYVSLNIPEVDLVGNFRIWKITKKLESADVEVDRPERILDRYLEQYRNYEDFGIYPMPGYVSDIPPVAPSGFTASNIATAVVVQNDGTVLTYFTVTIPRVDGMAGYRVRYRKQGTTAWTELDVAQPSSGNAVVVTPAVEAGQTYEFQVCSYNKVSQTSDWVPTTPVTKTAGADTTAPATPTGLTATAGVRKIILAWNANTEVDLKEYLVYRNTTNDSSTATLIARVRTTRLEVDSPIGVTYYFWVRAVDFSGNTSGWSSSVSAAAVAENISNVTDTAPAVPTISVTSEEVDTATEFRTWITVTITRVDGAGGYVVAYRKQGETNWNKIYVEQPSSGNPVVRTPDLPASTTYEVMACSVSPKGVASSWTSVTTVTTQANNVAPNAPSSVSAVVAIGALLLQCSEVSATDFSHYEWYVGTTSPPSTVVGTSSKPYFYWKATSYSSFYVGAKAVDTAGNKSSLAHSGTTTYTPKQVNDTDIAPDAVTAEKILDGAVQEAKIAANAVTASKIKDAEVAWSKLADTIKETIGKEHFGYFKEAEELVLWSGTTIVDDSTASGGKAIKRPSTASSGTMWYGPYTTVPGGNYWALYRLKVASNTSTSNVLKLDVSVTRGGNSNVVLGYRYIKPSNFDASNTWQVFAVPVEIRNDDTNVEIRGMEFQTGITDVYCDWVALVPMSKISTDLIEAYAVTANKIAAGAVTASKMTVAQIFIEGLTWTDNSPSTGYVSWSACTVYYQGTAYNISAGNTNAKYIYWNVGNSSFTYSNTKPDWTETRFMIAINENGYHKTVWNATYIHGGTLITGTVTAQEIQAGSISADRLQTGTITGSEANRLMPDSKVFRVVSVGLSSTSHPVSRGLYDARTGTLIAQAGRSYMVSVFDRSSQSWVSHTTYDVFGSISNADAMANALNALDASKIVVIHTYDEPQTNRFGTNNKLLDAMLRCGASRAVFGANNDKFRYRSAYILVGIPGCGEGNGIELYSGTVDNDTNGWVETSFAIEKGNLVTPSKTRVLNLAADQIVLQGTTYLTSWGSGSDITKIDGGKIYTGSITADKIAAGQITTEKLAVLYSTNLIPDSDFELGDASKEWSAGTAVTSSPHSGNYCLRLPTSGDVVSKSFYRVKGGVTYYLEGWFRVDSGATSGAVYFEVYWYDAAKNYISTTTIGFIMYIVTTWACITGTATAPSNAAYARVRLRSTVTGAYGYADDLVMHEQTPSVWIQDGAVQTNHIRFNVLDSDPTYETGKMWYRGDLDELRFASGNTLDKVAQIPKIPLGAPMRQLFWFRSSWLPAYCEKTTIPSGSSGYTTWYSDYVEIGTGSTANSTCQLLKKWLSLKTTWDKKRIVSCLILTGALNSQRLRIWSGTDFQTSGKPSFGVYVDNNSDNYSATIYGFAWNGTSATTISLGTLNTLSEYLITMEFTPGLSLKFFINGVSVGTITTNLPSGATNSETAFNIEIFNYSAYNKIVYLFQVACVQEF